MANMPTSSSKFVRVSVAVLLSRPLSVAPSLIGALLKSERPSVFHR